MSKTAFGTTLVALALAILAPPAFSQVQADPQADLAMLLVRAKSVPNGTSLVENLLQYRESADRSANVDQLRQQVLGWADIRNLDALPLDIELVVLLPVAEMRANYFGQIMAADLNGDWSVSRQELVAVIGNRRQAISDIFILGDRDLDNILTTDEIKAAVTTRAQMDMAGRTPSTNFVKIIDLDGDGILTRDEFERVIAALTS